jgi:hypothetical protein
MLFSKPELMTMVIEESAKQGIEPELACAVVHSQSQWMPASMNHSPDGLMPGFDFPETELNGRQTTYGLFQFTGEQARNAGYKGTFLDLIDPPLNTQLGVSILTHALHMTSKREVGLIIYLGRSRAPMVPGILNLIEPYKALIAGRGPCSPSTKTS